ncbi:hypothetical protein COCOR_02471 [Corallococcus coralloides DSM 2259]|uniref:Lipoprotein n=1 Tax=Corallococcus coralloides (strain ATCC 25202 / DSM 2259 / NBRC 100086 / M2) TaxID=1144275 RepID=H8MQS1_CORCM|nr:hypothetical protein [Corallococcus coralloides]AFE04662.1 hypothetical protein COCOR_02471 [Corallococcus coralloides DSM 2259]
MRHGALVVALLLGACAKPKEERVTSREGLTAAELPQPRGAATVRMDQGTYSAPSVRFSADFLGDPPVTLMLVALSARSEDGGTWQFRMAVDETFVKSKHATARLIPRTALGPGLAVVDYQQAQGPSMAMDEGTLELTVTGKQAKGEVRMKDGRVRATFEGPLTVECTVPPAWLGGANAQAAPAPVPTSPEGGTVRVLDEAQATPQCRSVAAAFR